MKKRVKNKTYLTGLEEALEAAKGGSHVVYPSHGREEAVRAIERLASKKGL